MKEISSMSGFSVSTVSKALNDKKDISIETRNTIKGIAQKFNYIPNNYAVALRGKKTKSIAIILPSITVSYYNHALFYLQKKAVDLGYRVLLYQTFNSRKAEIDYINSLNDGSIDGVFIISNSSEESLSRNQIKFPIVIVNLKKEDSINDIDKLVKKCFIEFLGIN